MYNNKKLTQNTIICTYNRQSKPHSNLNRFYTLLLGKIKVEIRKFLVAHFAK